MVSRGRRASRGAAPSGAGPAPRRVSAVAVVVARRGRAAAGPGRRLLQYPVGAVVSYHRHAPQPVEAVALAGTGVGDERAQAHGEGYEAGVGFERDVLLAKIVVAGVLEQRFQPQPLLPDALLTVLRAGQE